MHKHQQRQCKHPVDIPYAKKPFRLSNSTYDKINYW